MGLRIGELSLGMAWTACCRGATSTGAYVEESCSLEEIVQRGFEPEMALKVIRLVDRNEYKRRQAAPGIRITPKAFGIGRRMPIARGDFRKPS